MLGIKDMNCMCNKEQSICLCSGYTARCLAGAGAGTIRRNTVAEVEEGALMSVSTSLRITMISTMVRCFFDICIFSLQGPQSQGSPIIIETSDYHTGRSYDPQKKRCHQRYFRDDCTRQSF